MMYSFPLEEQEQILKKDLVSLTSDGQSFNGALYLTNERLVFVGYLLGISQRYMDEVLLYHIKDILARKTFFVIPNVIEITTLQGRTVTVIASKRDQWIKAIEQQMAKLP